MPGGSTRRKAPRAKGKTKARAASARPPRRAALGNDPFTRGAAARAPAPQAAPPPAASSPRRAAALPASPSPPRSGGEGRGEGAGRPAPPAPATAARLNDLERRLDRTLAGLEGRLEGLAKANLLSARDELEETLKRLLPSLRAALGGALDLARLVEPPERLDRFGMDARFAERAQPLLDFFLRNWWRVAVRNAADLPAGPAVLVANHGGAVPWDALVLRHALRRESPPREVRPLLDDRECALPVVGPLAIRLGAVRAAPDSAERLLHDGDLVAVFPEGSAAARKGPRERYRILHFGRGGFAKVALRAAVPIVPVAIVGSEEASPAFSRPGWLPDLLGLPVLAAAPLGAAGIVPLPSRWSIRFGEPIATAGLGRAAADDAVTVHGLAEQVREAVQAMLDEDLAARGSVYL
jgi:1-acyl-sn-glycerol-3-phosphate acyltransferase